jgi:GNAT superfamily N-acetyltransferase
MNIVIEPLSRHPELVPVAARWHWSEWGHTDPGGTMESWTAALAAQAGADQIPGTLLALADGAPVGVACLVARDMPGYEPAAGLTPWLKGLYVVPAARRQGHGERLVRRCEAWAAALGHDTLYLFTERGSAAQSLYERLAWLPADAARYEGIDVIVMRTSLPAPARAHGPRAAGRGAAWCQ